jgi:hypothetical protein
MISSPDGGYLLIGDLAELRFVIGYRAGQRLKSAIASRSVGHCKNRHFTRA